jgi:hypothetical protein
MSQRILLPLDPRTLERNSRVGLSCICGVYFLKQTPTSSKPSEGSDEDLYLPT